LELILDGKDGDVAAAREMLTLFVGQCKQLKRIKAQFFRGAPKIDLKNEDFGRANLLVDIL